MLLSVIIVNYNVKYFLEQCLCSVRKALAFSSLSGDRAEVLVIDNNSGDASVEYLTPRFPFVRFIANKENTGYARANNQGLKEARGKYVLFLNPDTILPEDIFKKTLAFLNKHEDAGALGVHMIDGSGRFLKESKRGLPTAWASFCKMSGLTGIFPSSKAFSGYYMGHLDTNTTHEVEVLAGAFLMARRDLLQSLGGFDERFFMYAEDIDLSYRITQAGYKNYYFAETVIIHFKGESTRKDAKYVKLFYKAMRQFVEKHYGGFGGKVTAAMLNAAIRFRTGLAMAGKSGNDTNENPRRYADAKFHEEQARKLSTAVALHGDLEAAGYLTRWLDIHNIRIQSINGPMEIDQKVRIKDADGMVCIFLEGKTFSFTEIIKTVRLLTPTQTAMIHASGSGSIVGSFDKNGQGITIDLQSSKNMITKAQAIELASTFTSSQGEVMNGVYYAYSDPEEYQHCFYFDFRLVDKDGKPADVMAGGAPGFIIDKNDGNPQVVGWERYHQLKNSRP